MEEIDDKKNLPAGRRVIWLRADADGLKKAVR
jgi:hypothetical protein